MKTFAAQALLFTVSFVITAIVSAADVSIPIKISDSYGETFRSLEMPEKVSVASPVFTTFEVHPIVIGERYEVRQFPFATTTDNTNNNSTLQNLAPLQDSGRPRDRNSTDRKTSLPVFPSVPSDLGGTPSIMSGMGTALSQTFSNNATDANNAVKFSKPAVERKGFSLDGTEDKTRNTGFENLPSIAATLQNVFDTPPPLPRGAADSSVIPKALLQTETEAELTDEANSTANAAVKIAEKKKTETNKEEAGTKVNGMLLVATVLLVMTLVFVVITAADYHHRWVQSLTTLNRRYTMPYTMLSSDPGWDTAGTGDTSVYTTGTAYQSDDLMSGFVYNSPYRNSV